MAEQSEQQPNWTYIALGGLVAAWLAIVLYFYVPWNREPSAEQLEQAALTAIPAEREKAALKLAAFGEAGREPLRRVLKATNDPLVRAACLEGLCTLWDYDSMDAMVAGLSDESEAVRRKSHLCVQKMLQLNLDYNPADLPAVRTRAAGHIGEEWKKMKSSVLFPEWLKTAREKAAAPVTP